MKGLCEKSFDAIEDSAPVDAEESLKVRLSGSPPTEEPVCPKSGPPASWFEEYKLYTEDCSACKALELGLSRKGKVHSSKCCANYVRWLRTQRRESAEAAELERRALRRQPTKKWIEDHEIFTPDCPACAAVELGVNPEGLSHSDLCLENFARWMASDSFSDPVPPDKSELSVSSPKEGHFGVPVGQNVDRDVFGDVGQGSSGGGVKRPFEPRKYGDVDMNASDEDGYKDIAQGAGKAKSLGISSPTPSTESLKMAVAVGGHANSYVTTLDCSAAFMHTPLGKERKVIVKLPVSISWEDLSPVYVDLERSLNGLRSASLDWLSFVQGIVKPIGLKSTAANPCVFTGTGVIMIIYVDDVLIVSSKPETGKLIWDKLNEKVPTKMTGCLKPNQGGSVKFVGRIIRRVAGAKELFMGIQSDYLNSCFKDFGMEKMKIQNLLFQI